MSRSAFIVLVLAHQVLGSTEAGAYSPVTNLTDFNPQALLSSPLTASISQRIAAVREKLKGMRSVHTSDRKKQVTVSSRDTCNQTMSTSNGLPHPAVGFPAALQQLEVCRLGRQLQEVLSSEVVRAMEEIEVVKFPHRALLFVAKVLNRGRGFISDAVGSETLAGGAGLGALGNSLGSTLTAGLQSNEPELQGVSQQYVVNYQRGPWTVQSGVQVGVVAQENVDSNFFLPPPGQLGPQVPVGAPPVLQSPQDTFNQAANEAYNMAFPNGYAQGYAYGQVSSTMGSPNLSLPSLPAGNPDGYNEGIQVGWVQGMQEGYAHGFTQARQYIMAQGLAVAQQLPSESAAVEQSTLRAPEEPEAAMQQELKDQKQPEVSLQEPASSQSPGTSPVAQNSSSLEETDETNLDGDANEIDQDLPPKVQAFSGPLEDFTDPPGITPVSLLDIRHVEGDKEEPTAEEHNAAEGVQDAAEGGKQAKSTIPLTLIIAGVVTLNVIISMVALKVYARRNKPPSKSDAPQKKHKLSLHPTTPSKRTTQDKTLGAEVAAHRRSIARVQKWQEGQQGVPNTPNRSDSAAPSPSGYHTSAYMKHPTMFDFKIYNPTAEFGDIPESPSIASEQGSEHDSGSGFYQPESHKSTDVLQRDSLNTQGQAKVVS